MKRHFDSLDDNQSTNQSSKFSKNLDNSRKIVSFQPNETESMNFLTAKLKSHQSTPYPNRTKFKQLQQQETNEDNEIATTDKTNEVSEKRNPEFLNKLGSLNRSFIRWIDIYFNKGYNYDFTPVCNDYIRFINNLKERYPIEIGSQTTNSVLNNDKPFGNESSPIKSKVNFNLKQQQFLNTPPQISGDKEYKLTPYPKHLINSNKQDSEVTTDKLVSGKNSESSTTSLVNKFEFQSQQNFTSINSTDNANLNNDEKKDVKFPATDNSSSNEIFKFGIASNTTNEQSATISKNLFDAKPINNITPTKDVLNSIKPIDNNFFSPENIFKTQFLTDVSKSIDQSIQQQSNNSLTIGSSNLASNVSSTGNDDDENYVPPKPESIFVEEDASYSIKCKLFLKKGDSYIEKGVGTLYIKETNEEAGNQLLIRGHNSLGTIMLNIRLKKTLPIQPTKNGILLTCVPNPPIEGKDIDETASFYIKVKSSEVGKELITFIEKYSK